MAYDYREAIREDVREWIKDNYEYIEDSVDDTTDTKEVYEFLYDTLWTDDDVTGNGSGSYTFSRTQAKKYVRDNLALAIEACNEFGYDMHHLAEKIDGEEWEYLDVTIRCYLLGEAITAEVERAERLAKGE